MRGKRSAAFAHRISAVLLREPARHVARRRDAACAARQNATPNASTGLASPKVGKSRCAMKAICMFSARRASHRRSAG
jgi:hypothetical protein